MLILMSLAHPRHRCLRQALLLGAISAACFGRLAALHGHPTESAQRQAVASGWVHDLPLRAQADAFVPVGGLALNHARFTPQGLHDGEGEAASALPAVLGEDVLIQAQFMYR